MNVDSDSDVEIVEDPSAEGKILISGDPVLTGDPDRRAILEPVISRVVDALGGLENGVYRLGDEVNGCLKDLKKLWRKDDTDDERTVARIFWEKSLLANDLVPILLATAGKGLVEDKRAISCADLIAAVIWPIDMAEELKELDDELDKHTDYTQLQQSHLHYKAALLQPGVIQALFGILIPPLVKSTKERTERDGQIINLILHLIRNLAFIRDPPLNAYGSSEQASFANLQSKLITNLSETHTIQLLLTIASNENKDPLFNGWNTIILEIFYLLFRGVKPSTLAEDLQKQAPAALGQLLAAEDKLKRENARKAASRHSRFGTTISVYLNPKKAAAKARGDEDGNDADAEESSVSSRPLVLHRQQAITQDARTIWDIKKRQNAKKASTMDELTRRDNLSKEAKGILKNLAENLLDSCFSSFMSALLKDMRLERAKIKEKDHIRLLFLTKWFLDFFLSAREKEKEKSNGEASRWHFGLVGVVIEAEWIVWVLKRMRGAVEEKPKAWTELQAGVECLTQLLLLIDTMSSTEISDPTLQEAAELIQQQLIYNGEVLDITYDSLRVYKDGTQSLAFLDSSVQMAYVLLRMLQRWSKAKGGEVYVRKKKTARRKKGGASGDGEDEVPEIEDEVEREVIIQETMFTFEAFEMKFANSEITQTLLRYLSSYKDFPSSQNMLRVVNLMHRQAIRAKAEGLYFNVSTLNLFQTLLHDQASFPRERPYKDLIQLVKYILRQFFKALQENPFLAVEALFPKNRGNWKQYSSWEPPPKATRGEKTVEDKRFPADLQVKKGYSWSDELGIVIAALVDAGQKNLVEWIVDILTLVIAKRESIINETDAQQGIDNPELSDDDDAAKALLSNEPSAEAVEKFTDFLIPYVDDEQADAATKNPQLKLLFRLSKFYILNEDADELEWCVPKAILPSGLRRTMNVINQFLETPIDLEGKKASDLLGKKARRRRRLREVEDESEGEADYSAGEGEQAKSRRVKKKEKKKKEQETYKSAEFINDSDEEYGDIDAFLEQEKLKRDRTAASAAANGINVRPPTMKATGTKKRRRKDKDVGDRKKRKGRSPPKGTPEVADDDSSDRDAASSSQMDVEEPTPAPVVRERPRPRPRPIKGRKSEPDREVGDSPRSEPAELPAVDLEDSDADSSVRALRPAKRGRLIISDDDED